MKTEVWFSFLLVLFCSSSILILLIHYFSAVMPERSEALGLMVYNCVSGNLWSRLLDDVPEIVPHGQPGYRKYW